MTLGARSGHGDAGNLSDAQRAAGANRQPRPNDGMGRRRGAIGEVGHGRREDAGRANRVRSEYHIAASGPAANSLV